MSYYDERISAAFARAKEISTKEHTKIVFFSDCHRGCGTWNDSFLPNKTLYLAALNYYLQNGFTYVEAGDGDELWENRNLARICEIHSDVFALLARFYYEGRFFMLYGNHDRVKARQAAAAGGRAFPFSAPCLQSLIIRTAHESQDLYVLHGHQADLFNDRLWPLARWLVRYLWKPLELAGFRDPTSAARNYRKSRAVEKRLSAWAEDHGKNLLAGHTHRPILPPIGAAGYFNCGSCVHPNGITCIELMSGQLSLIRWEECVNENNALYVCRRLLYGPRWL